MAKNKSTGNEMRAAGRSGWDRTLPAWIACLAISLAAIAIYSNTFGSSFHFDDETSILDNLAIRNVQDLPSIFRYSPTRFVTYLSFALNYSLGGLDVTGYHIVNLFLHLAASIMVWLFVREILHAPAFRGSLLSQRASLISLVAALVFAAHPLQTQAVTYIAQRAALLATLAYLSTLYFYSRSRLHAQSGGTPLTVYGGFAVAAAFAVIGLFSKETILTLPIALFLLEWFFLKATTSRIRWAVVASLLIFLAAPVSFFLAGSLELTVPGAPDRSIYLLTQIRVVMTYMRLLVLPWGQNLDYDFQLTRSLFDASTMLGAAFIALVGFTAYKLFARHRLLSFGAVWFFLTLLPESSILSLPDVIYEHRLYLPMVGFALIVAVLVHEITRRAKLQAIVLILVGVIGALGWATYERNKIWKDDITLWSDVISKSPNKPRGYSNRGKAYIEKKLYNSALIDLNRAIALDPSYGEAFNNRGNALLALGDIEKAIADYESARRVGISYKPVANRVLFNLGTAYFRKGQVGKSIEYYTQAISENAADPTYFYNRAVSYGELGNIAESIADYDEAVRLNPGYSKAFNNRGAMHERSGRLELALEDFTQASKLDASFALAQFNRARILRLKGKDAEAIVALTAAIALEPDRPDFHLVRGRSYLTLGDKEKSLADFQKAIALDPISGEAYFGQGRALEAMGKTGEAQQSYKTAAGLGYKREGR